MGFMDKFKEVAGKVGSTVESGVKSVSDNSKKMAEKMKLKKELGQVEADINAAYVEIGKKYVELNAAAPSADYAEFINTIKEKKDEASKLKAELEALEDKAPCPNCGANLDKTQKFCDKCGASVAAAAPAPAETPAPAAEVKAEAPAETEAAEAVETVEAEVVDEA